MKELTEIEILQETVIKGDYCIGCGACAAKAGSPFGVKMDEFGKYVAYIDERKPVDKDVKVLQTCPFSGVSKNEEELGNMLFPNNIKDTHIGNYLKTFAGHVVENDFREKGSSGGFGKWVGHILLKEKEIDYLIQVTPNFTKRSDVPLYDYQVFTDADEVIKGSKSSYYPTNLEKVIARVESTNGRYAITGVPCFIKAIRLISLENQLIADRVKFTLGIVCGGMKSANQSKMIGWQLGVHPDHLIGIDFRRKHKDKSARRKIYQVWSNNDDIERYETDSSLLGSDFGAGYFKPNACDYCDDVVSETADISFGDAWLPQYVQDPKGTSLVIVRNEKILAIMERYLEKGQIMLDEIQRDEAVKSQDGGFRHRREGLSFRLGKKEKARQWYPKKRVLPNQFPLSRQRKKIYTLREGLKQQSHLLFYEAMQKNRFEIFVKGMEPLMRKYKKANAMSLFTRGVNKLKRISASIFGSKK